MLQAQPEEKINVKNRRRLFCFFFLKKACRQSEDHRGDQQRSLYGILNKACLKSRIDINRGSYQAYRFGEPNYQLKGAELHEKRAPA